MKFETLNNFPQKKTYDDSDDAFKKLMAEAQLLDDVPFEAYEGVNLDAANELIARLSATLEEEGVCVIEDEEEAREMIINLEKLQRLLPKEKEISTALVRLKQLRNQSLEETA